MKSDKPVERLIASNGKLIAVTGDGTIMVYGDAPSKDKTLSVYQESIVKIYSPKADNIIKSTGITDGYALIWGTADIELLKSLVTNTSLNITAFDKDPSRVTFLRDYFDKLGFTANQLSFICCGDKAPLLPKYLSSLTIIDDISYLNNNNEATLSAMYESVRPYGGKIWINASGRKQKQLLSTLTKLNLYGIELKDGKSGAIISRMGPLQGSSDWTHNYGNISNTIKSDDDIVKAPLGILWFGGNSNLDVLPRHGHGPSEQVIDGRLIIQGINSISARDVYTGQLLWKHDFEKLKDDNWLVYYDETYDGNSPLDTKYNQVHLPGANARGTNFIVTKEFVYVIEGNKCRLLNIENGDLFKTFNTGEDSTQALGYIGVYKNYLILGNNFSEYSKIVIPDTIKRGSKSRQL